MLVFSFPDSLVCVQREEERGEEEEAGGGAEAQGGREEGQGENNRIALSLYNCSSYYYMLNGLVLA